MSEPRPLRVLFVGHTYVVGVNQAKLAAIAATGRAEVAVLVPDSWPSTDWGRVFRVERPYPQVRVFASRVWFGGRDGAHLYPPWTLWRVLSLFRPDIIQVEQEAFALSSFELALAAWACRRPLVLFCQENVDRPLPLRRWTRRFVLRRTAWALASNMGALDLLRGCGYNGPTGIMAQLGVDTTLFAPRPVNSMAREFTIGFVGRLVWQKGIDLLLAAVQQLRDKGLQFSTILCGKGPDEGALRLEAKKRQVADLVVWTGAVPHASVPEIMRRFDVLVLPSRTTVTWREQFGHVLIEAMAMGIPVVGSDCGAIPDVIGKADLVFRENHATDLTRILEDLMARPDWRKEAGAFCQRRACELFSNERVAEQLLEVWREVQRRGRTRHSPRVCRSQPTGSMKSARPCARKDRV